MLLRGWLPEACAAKQAAIVEIGLARPDGRAPSSCSPRPPPRSPRSRPSAARAARAGRALGIAASKIVKVRTRSCIVHCGSCGNGRSVMPSRYAVEVIGRPAFGRRKVELDIGFARLRLEERLEAGGLPQLVRPALAREGRHDQLRRRPRSASAAAASWHRARSPAPRCRAPPAADARDARSKDSFATAPPRC